MNTYGKELILDLHGCNVEKFTKYYINKFFKALCKEIDMVAETVTFWGYATQEELDAAPDHLAGLSAVQFIKTSNITIHALNKLKVVYLNIFSCKDFDDKVVMKFCIDYFDGSVFHSETFPRR